MLKVLFVDEQANDLAALKGALTKADRDWDITACSAGSAAKNLLGRTDFDVILIGAQLPDMPIADLCQEARNVQPNLVRIVICKNKTEEFSLRSATSAHQFLSPPFSSSELVNSIVRACSLKEFTRSKGVLQVVSQVKRLPTLPQNYQRINEILQRDEVSIADIADIINQDVAMVAKILQLANSAVFGARRKRVSSALSGVKMLGVDNLKLLVLAVEVFSQLDDKACANFKVEDLWEHCMKTGACAQKIARTLSEDKNFISDAMTAGTLHDLGKLVLINHFPQEFAKVLTLSAEGNASHVEAEKTVFGTGHAEIGGYLLGNWSLPQSIVEAVAYHHEPLSCARQELSPLTLVYAVNRLLRFNSESEAEVAFASDAYLQNLKLTDRVRGWWKICAETKPS